MDGFVAFCDAVRPSKVAKLSVAKCGIGPTSMTTLADAISDMAALSEVKLSFPNGKPLTLVKGMTEMKFSELGLKPIDVEFLATLITSFQRFTTTLNQLTVSSTAPNQIPYDYTANDYEGNWAEVDASGPKTYTLKGLQGEAEPNLDMSSLNLGIADLQLLSTVFTSFSDFTAALSEVNLCGADVKESDVAALRSAAPKVSFSW